MSERKLVIAGYVDSKYVPFAVDDDRESWAPIRATPLSDRWVPVYITSSPDSESPSSAGPGGVS